MSFNRLSGVRIRNFCDCKIEYTKLTARANPSIHPSIHLCRKDTHSHSQQPTNFIIDYYMYKGNFPFFSECMVCSTAIRIYALNSYVCVYKNNIIKPSLFAFVDIFPQHTMVMQLMCADREDTHAHKITPIVNNRKMSL